MTSFDEELFSVGDNLRYGPDNLFITRFSDQCDRAGFISFLVANFTVEEFVGQRNKLISPLDIMRSKGYVPKTVRVAMRQKDFGLPTVQDYFPVQK